MFTQKEVCKNCFLDFLAKITFEAGNTAWCFEIILILHDTPGSYDFHKEDLRIQKKIAVSPGVKNLQGFPGW